MRTLLIPRIRPRRRRHIPWSTTTTPTSCLLISRFVVVLVVVLLLVTTPSYNCPKKGRGTTSHVVVVVAAASVTKKAKHDVIELANGGIKLVDHTNVLSSEVDDEFDATTPVTATASRTASTLLRSSSSSSSSFVPEDLNVLHQASELLWNRAVQHAWELALRYELEAEEGGRDGGNDDMDNTTTTTGTAVGNITKNDGNNTDNTTSSSADGNNDVDDDDDVSADDASPHHDSLWPFLLCHNIPNMTGYERIVDILQRMDDLQQEEEDDDSTTTNSTTTAIIDDSSSQLDDDDDIILERLLPLLSSMYRNTNEQTCLHMRLQSTLAAELTLDDNGISVTPLTWFSKMRKGTFDAVFTTVLDDYGDGGMMMPEFTVGVCPDRNLTSESNGDTNNVTDSILESLFGTSSEEGNNGTTASSSVLAEEFYWEFERLPHDWWLMGGDGNNNNTNGTDNATTSSQHHHGDFLPRSHHWYDAFEGAGLHNTDDEDGQQQQYCRDIIRNHLHIESDGYMGTFRISLKKQEGTTPSSSFNMTRHCALSIVAGLAFSNQVCSIEVVPSYRAKNVHQSWLIQSGVQGYTPWFGEGLTGKGQVIALSDTGIDLTNCYFWDSQGSLPLDGTTDMSRRKVVQYIPFVDTTDVVLGHGTHVAGTLVGHKAENGIDQSTGMADGNALDAKVAFMDLGDSNEGSKDSVYAPHDITYLLSTGQEAGAKIHSVSWGTDDRVTYNQMDRGFDQYMYDNEEFLAIVAAGNNGTGNTPYTIDSPGISKNVITVGASHSYGFDLPDGSLGPGYIADFSSRGPTPDGRTKPDVIAPGYFIVSAASQPSEVGICDPQEVPPPGGNSAGLASKAGTSMATPSVSGTAALVRQYFEEGYYPGGEPNSGKSYSPTGALVKAVIMNGAQYMVGVDNGSPVSPYDNTQNFGRVSLTDSLYLRGKTDVQSEVFDRETLRNGESHTFNITVNTTGGCTAPDFSVTLVWTDPPAYTGCKACLMNDLDLVVNLDGTDYHPNGLTGPDRTNNAERVRVSATNGDTFFVRVSAHNLVTPSQNYALAVAGCLGGVRNTLPDSTVFGPQQSLSQTEIIVISVVSVVAFIVLVLLSVFLVRRCRGRR